jgi:TetR/AcrR family transcriptional repressor of nem operon
LNAQERKSLRTTPGTKQRILDTAANLIWSNSFEATGIAEILEKSNVGSGSFYWFFKTKEELVLAVLEDYRSKLWPVIAAPAFKRTGDPLERILLILKGYRTQLLRSDFRFGCPIGNLALELGNRYPRVRTKTAELFTAWRDIIERCLRECLDKRAADDEITSIAILVLSVMEGGIMQARAHKDIGFYDSSIRHLEDYLRILIDKM